MSGPGAVSWLLRSPVFLSAPLPALVLRPFAAVQPFLLVTRVPNKKFYCFIYYKRDKCDGQKYIKKPKVTYNALHNQLHVRVYYPGTNTCEHDF